MDTLTWRMRAANLLFALAVLLLMIALPTLSSILVSYVIETVAFHVGGAPAVEAAYQFLLDNANLYSAVVYIVFGTPIALWAYGMRRNARRRAAKRRRVTPAEAAAVQDDAVADAPHCSQVLTAEESSADTHLMAVAQEGEDPAHAAGAADPSCIQVSYAARPLGREPFICAALVGLGMQFVTTVIMVVVDAYLPAAMDEYQNLVESSGITSYGLMWAIATLVLPPLVEETGFRGLATTYLERAGVPFAVANLVQAVAFGVFHMNLAQGIYACVLGLALGYLAHRSGSIAPAMCAHAVYNFTGTLGSDVLNRLIWWMPISLELAVGVGICWYAFYRLNGRARLRKRS